MVRKIKIDSKSKPIKQKNAERRHLATYKKYIKKLPKSHELPEGFRGAATQTMYITADGERIEEAEAAVEAA